MCQRAFDLSLRKEHIEVSVLHVFSYHAQRVRGHTHTQQPDDVGVVQTGHDLDFLQEVVPNVREERGHRHVWQVFQHVGGKEEKKCGCESYLAWLVASALSSFTATRTERPSLSGSGDPSPRNSGRPSASQRWTCRSGFELYKRLLSISQCFPQ